MATTNKLGNGNKSRSIYTQRAACWQRKFLRRVKIRLAEDGMTQHQLAKESGVAASTLSSVMRQAPSENRILSMPQILRICEVTNIELFYT